MKHQTETLFGLDHSRFGDAAGLSLRDCVFRAPAANFKFWRCSFPSEIFRCTSARHDRCLYCRAPPVPLPLYSRYSRPRTHPGRPSSARHRASATGVTPGLVSQPLARPRSPFVGLCAISRALRPKFPQFGIVAPKAHFRPVPRLDTAAPFENVPFRNP